MSHELIPAVIQRLIELKIYKVSLAGGEPLVYKHLPTVIEKLAEAGIHQTLTTSGVGLKSNKDFIVNNLDLLDRLVVSIDAPNEDDHNRLRVFKTAWKVAMDFLQAVPPEKRRNKVRINTVVTKEFVVNSWISPMAGMITNLRVKEWFLLQPHPANKKPQFDLHSISNDDFWSVFTEAKRLVTNTKVVSRDISVFSKYWVLQPTGMLGKHTSTAKDAIEIDFLASTIETTQSILMMYAENPH